MPQAIESSAFITELQSEAIAAIVFLTGLYFAYLFHLQKRNLADALVANPVGRTLDQWWFAGWGFDWIYDKTFVQPFIWIAEINKRDFIDGFYIGIARLSEFFYRAFSETETGRIRWYTFGMAAGSVLFIVVVLLS